MSQYLRDTIRLRCASCRARKHSRRKCASGQDQRETEITQDTIAFVPLRKSPGWKKKRTWNASGTSTHQPESRWARWGFPSCFHEPTLLRQPRTVFAIRIVRNYRATIKWITNDSTCRPIDLMAGSLDDDGRIAGRRNRFPSWKTQRLRQYSATFVVRASSYAIRTTTDDMHVHARTHSRTVTVTATNHASRSSIAQECLCPIFHVVPRYRSCA